MGLIQRDALRTMLISYLGLVLGYLNKVVLFIIILSTEEIGLIGLILSVGMLFAQLSGLGAINTTQRFSPFFRNAARNNYGFLKLTFLIVLVGVLISSGLAYLFEDWVIEYYQENSSSFVKYYYWVIPVGVANILYLLLESHLRAIYKNVIPVFVRDIGSRILVTLLLLLLYFKLINFHQFLIANCLVFFIPVFVLFGYMIYLKEVKSLNVKIEVFRRFRSILIKYGLFSYINTLGGILVTTLDITMIASFVGLSGVGVYYTVMYLTSALQVPSAALLRIATPFVPVYWKEQKMKEMEKLYKDVSSMNLIIGSALFLIVWVSRVDVFSILPDEFQPGIWVFLFLMSGRLFDMYMGINSIILLTSKKFKVDILFTLILLFLVFGLNWILIPIYGIIGAAISTMIALVMYNLLRMLYVWYIYKIHPFKLNHSIIIALLFSTLLITEYIPAISDHFLLNGFIQTLEVLVLFVLPIVYFKLEPQLNDYINKVLVKLKLQKANKDV